MAGAGLMVALVLLILQMMAAPLAGAGFLGSNKDQNQNQNHESNDQEYYGASSKIKGSFLAAHNAVRARYGVPPLRWSNKLAKYARRWSSKRRLDCALMHSFPASPYGENVFRGTGWGWKAADAVRGWASEASYFDWKAQACYPGHVCGHFTQLVWNDTQLLGCARAQCFFGGVFITCEYQPPGNWKGEAPLT